MTAACFNGDYPVYLALLRISRPNRNPVSDSGNPFLLYLTHVAPSSASLAGLCHRSPISYWTVRTPAPLVFPGLVLSSGPSSLSSRVIAGAEGLVPHIIFNIQIFEPLSTSLFSFVSTPSMLEGSNLHSLNWVLQPSVPAGVAHFWDPGMLVALPPRIGIKRPAFCDRLHWFTLLRSVWVLVLCNHHSLVLFSHYIDIIVLYFSGSLIRRMFRGILCVWFRITESTRWYISDLNYQDFAQLLLWAFLLALAHPSFCLQIPDNIFPFSLSPRKILQSFSAEFKFGMHVVVQMIQNIFTDPPSVPVMRVLHTFYKLIQPPRILRCHALRYFHL